MRFSTKSIALLLFAITASTTFTGCFSAARRMARLERARQRYCEIHGGTVNTYAAASETPATQEYFPSPADVEASEPEPFPRNDSVVPPAPSDPHPRQRNRSDEIPKSSDPMPLFEDVKPTRSATAIPLPPRA